MKVVYGVPWIEVEFGWGERPEGYLLFLDKEQCIRTTQEDSRTRSYDGGYCGPVRPLYYVEIPFDSLEDSLKERLTETQQFFSPNTWKPRFAGEKIPILMSWKKLLQRGRVMRLDEYWNQVLKTYKANPHYRYGQAAFNVLYDVRPDLSEKVRGDTHDETGKDPFYLQTTNCANWHNFVAFLKENW